MVRASGHGGLWMKACSFDFRRKRLLAAYDKGRSTREVATVLLVNKSQMRPLNQPRRDYGGIATHAAGADRGVITSIGFAGCSWSDDSMRNCTPRWSACGAALPRTRDCDADFGAKWSSGCVALRSAQWKGSSKPQVRP